MILMSTKKSQKKLKLVILKIGNIASSILLEMLFDERADRKNIDVRTVSSGAKMEKESIKDAFDIVSSTTFDLLVIISPHASLPNPFNIILKASELKKPIIVISDILKEESLQKLKEKNIGYLVVKPDAMIGARREFLDPTEMALFNSDLLRVLSVGGVTNALYHEIDAVISNIFNNEEITLPQIILSSRNAIDYVDFANPYAKAKAQGALEIAEKVSQVNQIGCFKIKEREKYIAQVATAHEMMRIAAKLADEAREIEKTNNKVQRKPHSYEGEIQNKRLLYEKPSSNLE